MAPHKLLNTSSVSTHSLEHSLYFCYLGNMVARNQLIFHNQPARHQTVINKIWFSAQLFYFFKPPPTSTSSFTTIHIKWHPPPPNTFKLNTDGSHNSGLGSAGGSIRDHVGSWIIGFHRSIGPISSVEAELWALRDGLSLAMDLYLIMHDWHIHFSVIQREANRAADRMAANGVLPPTHYQVYHIPPTFMDSILTADLSPVMYSRVVSTLCTPRNWDSEEDTIPPIAATYGNSLMYPM